VANPIECQLLRTNTCDGCKVRPIYEATAADYSVGKIDEPQASARTSKANKMRAMSDAKTYQSKENSARKSKSRTGE